LSGLHVALCVPVRDLHQEEILERAAHGEDAAAYSVVCAQSAGGATLDGGAGNDILIGNAANQTLTGGTGNDIFGFEQPLSSPSTISDFNNTTEQDQIAVSAGGFGGGLTPGMDLSAVFETSGDNQFVSADSRFHFDTGNQTLYYSADGTSGSEVAMAELPAGTILQANNLLIVR
jgi:Ca2+-binding RTX toxin-like protein